MLKKSVMLLSAAALLVSAVTVASSSSAMAKSKKSVTHRIASSSRGAYFVPPPPPYQPSILPEMQSRSSGSTLQSTAQKEPENPYKKYIYTRNEADTPTPVRPNKYVSYWSKG